MNRPSLEPVFELVDSKCVMAVFFAQWPDAQR
jgi:hypothetical protein